MHKRWSETLGWYGVVAILLAYLLNSLNIVNASSFSYLVLNLTGAIGVLIDAWRQRNYQAVVLNLIWAVIAFIVLIRISNVL